MKVNLKQIQGPWNQGWVLDKHMLRSTFLGNDEQGHPKFDSHRTEVGEATFQLKYRSDLSQANRLAEAVAEHIYPKLDHVGFIVPMPASTQRPFQPVTAVAQSLGRIVSRPVFERILLKSRPRQPLKDLPTKSEKVDAISGSFSIGNQIVKEGAWNVLLIDDLFHTGATMEAACASLRTYAKVKNVYVAALT